MLELIFRPAVAVSLTFLLISAAYRWSSSNPDLPDLPWVGLRNEWFAKFRCRWRTTINYREYQQIAYQNFSVKGLPCILCTFASDIITLPAASTDWIIKQSDEVLSTSQAHIDALQTDYTFSDTEIARQPHHEHVVRTDLVRQLGSLTMDIMDELTASFDETWGLDTEEWKTVPVFENMRTIVARTSNRVFVGLPLCRNTSYLSLAEKYSRDIPFSALIISQLPYALHPVLAPIIALPNRYHVRQIRLHLDPVIEARTAKVDPEKGEPEAQPNDFLQWSINNAKTRLSDKPEELSPHMLVGRLLAMNFAAIHTSTITITNAIFDLVSAAPSLRYLEEFQKEAALVLAEDEGVWTKRGLSKMYKIDSALRESLRLHTIVTVGLVRKVVAKAGVTTPEWLHLPYGALVGIPVYGIHNDANNYTNPEVYDALRCFNQRALIDAAEGEEGAYLKKANLSVLLLAYIVLNYDIEPLTERPSGIWFLNVSLPDMKASIKVRRKKPCNGS